MAEKEHVQKLSPTMLAMLRRVAEGRPATDGLHGRSEHGGAAGTWSSLIRRGLLDERGKITEAGRAAAGANNGTPSGSPASRAPVIPRRTGNVYDCTGDDCGWQGRFAETDSGHCPLCGAEVECLGEASNSTAEST
jgi:hypothetical protein